MDWQQLAGRIAVEVEDRLDRARTALGQRLRGDRPARVVPYRGYGTADLLYVRGRVLRGLAPGPASADDRWWANLANSYRRLESDEVPGARVRVRLHGTTVEATADAEGHFRAELRPAAPLPRGLFWHDARVDLLEPAGQGATAPIAVPMDPRFGVISDLDDTVLQTGARDLMRMAREVLFGNAHTRIPFPGVGEFYRALHTAGRNPLFYVSSSPWNLYDVLNQFLQLHRIPAGPMDLRDWGVSAEEVLPTGHHGHKRQAIDRILQTFPRLSFILVGDSGQEDPEIYRDVVHDHPDRILGIYIRSVVSDPDRVRAIGSLASELHGHDIELVLVEDTAEAARHAAAHGWIEPEAVDAVARERERDRNQEEAASGG